MDKNGAISLLWQRICLDDDVKAFESFYYLLYDPLVKFCTMYVYQREVAEEIVSDIFVKSWMSRSDLQHLQRADTYLFVSVKNQSLNYLKKYSSIRLVQADDSQDAILVDAANPQVQLERKELNFFLDKAINDLPLQCRIIFKLIKEDGLKYKEVAEILGISHRTVQTQLFRAIKKLSISLSKYNEPYSAKVPGNDFLLNISVLLSLAKIFF